MLVVDSTVPQHRGSQQLFWQQDLRTQSVGAAIGAADAVETVARCDHPRILRRSLQILAEVLEDGRVLRRCQRKIIQRLVKACGQRCRRNIMSQDSAVEDLGEERPLRNQLSQHARDILLALRRKGLFIPCTPAECHDYRLLPPWQSHGSKRSKPVQRSSRRRTYRGAQKLAAIPALFRREFAQGCIQRGVGLGTHFQFALSRNVMTSCILALIWSFSCCAYCCCKAICFCASSRMPRCEYARESR